MDQIHLELQKGINNLQNEVLKTTAKRNFLRQQILNQFLDTDIEICRRVLGDAFDDFNINKENATKALNQSITTVEKITGNILNFKSSAVETMEDRELRKIYIIQGKIEKINYTLEFITEFKVSESETKEFVKEIQKLVFFPSYPVLEKMSLAMRKEHRIETIMSSLYMFHCLKEEENKVLAALQQYEEIDINLMDDGSFVIHVIISSTSRFFLKGELTYNLYSTNIFHKITVTADEELIIRYSQHKNVSILKGDKNVRLDEIIDFIESIFEVYEEGSDQSEGRNEESEEK